MRLIATLATPPLPAQKLKPKTDRTLAEKIDALFKGAFPADEPGGAKLQRGGKDTQVDVVWKGTLRVGAGQQVVRRFVFEAR